MADIKRTKRVGALIQQELGKALLRHPENPIFTRITIVSVEVSADFAVAKVFFSLFDENQKKEATVALKKSAGFLRYTLAQSLNLRKTPALTFIYDESIQRGQKLSRLIDQAIKEDETRT